jgi:hypothetical protein
MRGSIFTLDRFFVPCQKRSARRAWARALVNSENGGSGGARTRHESNNDGPASEAPSQIASQRPVSSGHDLSQVVTAWAKLSSPLKAAILAIVDSATSSEGGVQ